MAIRLLVSFYLNYSVNMAALKLKLARGTARISQMRLAELAKTSQGHVSWVERGEQQDEREYGYLR